MLNLAGNNMTSKDLIAHFDLTAHPEGGFYRRTYAATLPIDFNGRTRHVCTAILFLLEACQYSRLHRIPQDEIWHFYCGDPLRLVMLLPNGTVREVILGHEILAGQFVQYCVPAGAWFGAAPCIGGAYSFVGCTVSPGFVMEELEFGERDSLLKLFPGGEKIIREFC